MKLNIEHVNKTFDSKVVLKDAHFTFETGKIYGLIGRNGAGKTTLFNCIHRDLKVNEGHISIIDENGERELGDNDIGYVLSTPVVPDFLTAREFIKFYIEVNFDKIKNMKTVDEYLDMVMIKNDDRDKLLKDYSHGMKNKIQMLVHFISSPHVLLLDEPLTSFDVVVADEMKQLLRKLKEQSMIIFSTHIMELALDLCDEIVILNHGELKEVRQGEQTTEEYKESIIQALRDEDND